jgi:hypothetical protein
MQKATCWTEEEKSSYGHPFIDEFDNDFDIQTMFGEWYNPKDGNLWTGVELFTPGGKVFMWNQDGTIFQKQKAHDENNKEDDTICLFCIKEKDQWEAYEINATTHNENWFYDKWIQPQDGTIPEQYSEFQDKEIGMIPNHQGMGSWDQVERRVQTTELENLPIIPSWTSRTW